MAVSTGGKGSRVMGLARGTQSGGWEDAGVVGGLIPPSHLKVARGNFCALGVHLGPA